MRRIESLSVSGQVTEVDFVYHPDLDADVSGKNDLDLGHQVRLTVEENSGAWVFEVTNGSGVRKRYLRTVPRS